MICKFNPTPARATQTLAPDTSEPPSERDLGSDPTPSPDPSPAPDPDVPKDPQGPEPLPGIIPPRPASGNPVVLLAEKSASARGSTGRPGTRVADL
jgi:hypothetical protein